MTKGRLCSASPKQLGVNVNMHASNEPCINWAVDSNGAYVCVVCGMEWNR